MRCVSILTGPETHLDHLGVLSALIGIPLIVTEEKTLLLAKKYYPGLNVELKEFAELSIAHLAENYDVIFESGKFFATELAPFIQLLFGKKMRFVFCPHGNSDKGHSLQTHVEQDLCLVYGDHLEELLRQNGAAQKISQFIRTGNYRYPYYLQNRAFYDALCQEIVFGHFAAPKPVILYAPTWNDKENPTSFFSSVDRLIEELSGDYNLLIKLHPFLSEDHPAHILHILARYEDHLSAHFLTDFPPIYPLLSRCSVYLGDYSSIGYDFLVFDKPLYFLNPSPLSSCGLEIPHGKSLKRFLSETLETCDRDFSAQRKKTYRYAFGEERDPGAVHREVVSKLQKDEANFGADQRGDEGCSIAENGIEGRADQHCEPRDKQ